MVRSNFYTQPYRKELEIYTEFSGGMNSFAPNGDLRDNELTMIKNKDLGNRGSLLRRTGMTKFKNSPVDGKGQGYFRYYKEDGTYDEILATNGKLYTKQEITQFVNPVIENKTTAETLTLTGTFNDGDVIYKQSGQYYKEITKKEVVLDGSLAWVYSGDFAGYKEVFLTGFSNSIYAPNTAQVVKYNGNILPYSSTLVDTINWSNVGQLSIRIADTDSGWGETYVPTVDEIKAYFNGWKMHDVNSSGNVYNSGTKYWAKINRTSSVFGVDYSVTTLPTTVNDSLNWQPYKLTYDLATPEGVLQTTTGSMTINTGDELLIISITDSETGNSITVIATDRFRIGSVMKVMEQIISGLSSFQTTRPIEAVQYQDKMYIATGTKLVVYDGLTFTVAVPYAPTALEGLYYGFNALAADPVNYMTDGVSAGIQAAGMTFDKRYGIVNEPVTVSGYYLAPAGYSMEYQYEYRTSDMTADTWTVGRAYGTTKAWSFTPTKILDHQLRVTVRKVGTTTPTSFYMIPKYTVKAAPDPTELNPDTDNIDDCNRILVHADRIVFYGDDVNKDMIYISHIENPLYFPVPNCIRFENPKNESLQIVMKYRDKLVAMTDTTIQALYGTSPADYTKVMLNTQVGCIAPYSAVVVENVIYFLSYDGVYRLKQVGMTEDRANVDKIDTKISNLVPRDKDAYAVFHDLQYHLVFPSKKQRFRFYNEFGAWVMDESEKLNLSSLYIFDNSLYAQSVSTGDIFKFDKTVYNDDGYVYMEEIQTKGYHFGQPYHPKTMRQLLFSISPKMGDFKAKLSWYLDNVPKIEAVSGEAVVGQDGYVTWDSKEQDNINVLAGAKLGTMILGESVLGEMDKVLVKQSLNGKGYEVKFTLRQDKDGPNEIFGWSFIFKVKKPK